MNTYSLSRYSLVVNNKLIRHNSHETFAVAVIPGTHHADKPDTPSSCLCCHQHIRFIEDICRKDMAGIMDVEMTS